MADKKRLIIIDSNALIHRAYHALPPLITKKGELVNAIYGFLLVFFKAIREFQPDYIAATFDFPAPTFRHKKFKEYKAKRPPAPEELYQQIPRIKEILKSFNVPIFEKEGFEADDLIGTISRLAPKKQVLPEIETIILSGDLDTLQLVNPYTKVYALRKGVKDIVLYNRVEVEKKYGLSPHQLLDFKALKGDPSDNIPGVPGIGEKTATELIKKFGNLENLYSALNQRPLPEAVLISVNQRLRAKLEEYKEQAFFSKSLAQIKKDVPIDFNLKKCRWGKYDKEKVIQILKNLEFYSLIKRLSELKKSSRDVKIEEVKVEQPRSTPSSGGGGATGQAKNLILIKLMPNKNLSEESQWFLRNLQKLQDDFAESVGGQIVTTDKVGELVTKMSGAQRVCKLIMATEEGKKNCGEAYKMALSLVKKMKEPAFMDCYAGYASLWVPIKVKGEIVGSITGCGGRYDRGESQEELRAKYSKLADELGVKDKEDFLKAAVDEVKNPITEEEMKKRAERLSKLVGILAEETALSEVFGVV